MADPDHHPVPPARRARRNGSHELVVDALRAHGPSSQAALARATGLSPATVNNVVRVLQEEGVATVGARNGRQSVVTLAGYNGAVASVQVNVSGVHATLFDFARQARYDETVVFGESSTDQGGDPSIVVDLIDALVGRAGIRVKELAGVAAAMQGPVSTQNGQLLSWARLQMPHWKDVSVAAALKERLGVPVLAENDANLAALAEWTWGAGRGSSHFVYVMCSANVGGGIVVDGKLQRGGDGMAGEIGHMVLEKDGPVCFCGSRGCLTTYLSERSILLALAGSGSAKGSLEEVVEAARRGDGACARVLFEAGHYLGRALANTAKVLAPNVIAIGGAFGRGGSLVFESLRSSVELNSLIAVSPSIRIRNAELWEDGVVLGGLAGVLSAEGRGLSELPSWAKQSDPTAHLPINHS
ncbi:ROK family protein [Nocardioides sp. DS6]|uniref:ROK family protein n=1 Tax=Nocardioides eburneus TaxID=3231482 RepID=A0ABV3SYJ9_9ACTN